MQSVASIWQPLARWPLLLFAAPFRSSSSSPSSPPHSRVQLGVCVTVLKQQCREHGVARWPFRKIRKLDHMLCALEGAVNRPGAASSSQPALTAQQAHTNHQRKRKIGAVKETLSGLLTDPNSAAHMRLGKIKYKRFRPFLAEDDRNIRPRPLHAGSNAEARNAAGAGTFHMPDFDMNEPPCSEVEFDSSADLTRCADAVACARDIACADGIACAGNEARADDVARADGIAADSSCFTTPLPTPLPTPLSTPTSSRRPPPALPPFSLEPCSALACARALPRSLLSPIASAGNANPFTSPLHLPSLPSLPLASPLCLDDDVPAARHCLYNAF
ncbi:unnamed protein product [Closterium sp. NIES-64]|nr:unnamed protein product [Closterium sp. NIES-64]CAI6004618.1 unnamed protein product [Closterium sp. NIES-64]